MKEAASERPLASCAHQPVGENCRKHAQSNNGNLENEDGQHAVPPTLQITRILRLAMPLASDFHKLQVQPERRAPHRTRTVRRCHVAGALPDTSNLSKIQRIGFAGMKSLRAMLA